MSQEDIRLSAAAWKEAAAAGTAVQDAVQASWG